MIRRELVLMPDYGCFPLWEFGAPISNFNPSTLPISIGLQADLRSWSSTYDALLNKEDPRDSGFLSKEDKASYTLEGTKLKARLIDELGPGFAVTMRLVIRVKSSP